MGNKSFQKQLKMENKKVPVKLTDFQKHEESPFHEQAIEVVEKHLVKKFKNSTHASAEQRAYNQPAYDITFVPRNVRNIDTLELCRTLNMTREDFDERMARVRNRRYNPGYSTYTEQVFMSRLSVEEFAKFQEKMFMFPGFYVQKRSIRQYAYGAAGVLFGDVGEVSQKKIDEDSYYSRGDYIGTQGRACGWRGARGDGTQNSAGTHLR